MNIYNKLFLSTIIFCVIAELVSFFGYFYPILSLVGGLLLISACLVLSLRDIRFGILIILAELIIGSQGYLFSFVVSDTVISLRIALWIIVMAVWFSKELLTWFSNRESFKKYLDFPYKKQFIFLSIVLLLGIIIGYFSSNDRIFYFLEFKRWLYILLLIPMISSFKSKNDIKKMLAVFLGAAIVLSFKAITLIYIFSHSFYPLVYDVYTWMRVSLLGEITRWPSGFSRVFMQSQIFLLPAAVGSYLYLYLGLKKVSEVRTKLLVAVSSVTILFTAIIIASLSRSFWVGIVAGICVTSFVYIYINRPKFSKIVTNIFTTFTLLIISTVLIFSIVRFPWPNSSANFDASLLSERAIKMEAGAASRWSLLPVMWSEIQGSPLWGYGLGKSLTFQTYDPRVLESSPSGEYTTYAFEWGWLDIWLKLGILGVAAYIWLLFSLGRDSVLLIKKRQFEGSVLFCSVIIIFTVHFFTPYLNHPLGFGYLGLLIVYMAYVKKMDLQTT